MADYPTLILALLILFGGFALAELVFISLQVALG